MGQHIGLDGNQKKSLNLTEYPEHFNFETRNSNSQPGLCLAQAPSNEAEVNTFYNIGGNVHVSGQGNFYNELEVSCEHQRFKSESLGSTKHDKLSQKDTNHASSSGNHSASLGTTKHDISNLTGANAASIGISKHNICNSSLGSTKQDNRKHASLGRTKQHTGPDIPDVESHDPSLGSTKQHDELPSLDYNQQATIKALDHDNGHGQYKGQLFRTSEISRHSIKHGSYSEAAIKKQSDIIASIWPNITHEANLAFPDFAATYSHIKRDKLPNFLGAKIPVRSQLNIHNWRQSLAGYHDSSICDFLEYGWPLGYQLDKPPTTTIQNHPSATHHPQHIAKFIATELRHGAIVGPFPNPPFTPWTRCSPLMTRQKKDSSDRRVIVDLSFPSGEAVNDGIDNSDFLGTDISYSLPTVGDLIARLQQQGKGAFMWKNDLERAYRQLRVDPIDTPPPPRH